MEYEKSSHRGTLRVSRLKDTALLICCCLLFVADIYVCCLSYANAVAPKGKYLAIVSATVETSDPEAELKPGLALLGKIDKQFLWVSNLYEPTDDGRDSKVSNINFFSVHEEVVLSF